MKKLLFGLVLISFSSLAEDSVYFGFGLAPDNVTRWQDSSVSVQDGTDLSYNLFGGYKKSLVSVFDLGLELEYQFIGKAEFLNALNVDGNGFFLNLRPRYSNNNMYTELLFGVGMLQMEGLTFATNFKDSDSDISFQFGYEFGFHIMGLDLGAGYRYRFVELDGVDLTVKGLMFTARYHF